MKNRATLRGMTGYGKAISATSLGTLQVEIQSVNRRHLELHVHLPDPLFSFEIDIRKEVEKKVLRGNASLTLTLIPNPEKTVSFIPNLPLVKSLNNAWRQIAKEVDLDKKMPVELLVQEKNLFQIESFEKNEESLAIVNRVLNSALDQLVLIREEEGERTGNELLLRIEEISGRINDIEKEAKNSPDRYREKLSKRIVELQLEALGSEMEEKVLREVAIYSDRIDISEEIERFRGHLNHLSTLLRAPLKPLETKGKLIEFILQELNREINTAGAKAQDLKIGTYVVTIKAELEKMKEQVQNIE